MGDEEIVETNLHSNIFKLIPFDPISKSLI